ncbi:unnamed protein product [Brachionus calyciflorus]|uniref:Uncharacterized protein n=1 Tax=Brachionus calyciflorus TaxID=104777 RepID=A0A814Q5T9_9BILA|nr:unnamed protein product [Brachionus calyciflorus]
MNISSPFITGANLEKYGVNEKKWIESGIFGEGLIFNKKIDFHRTVNKTFGLNMIYLKQFYKDLIESQMEVTFDIDKSGVVVSRGPPCVMAVDIDLQPHIIIE